MTTPGASDLAVAYSGGGDSTALLFALREAAPDLPLHAFIVDHRLRPESAEEARRAADMAAAVGARPRILTWSAPRRGQGHARLARHRLLAHACRDAGVGVLCLAHTLDDRIETLRMRAARGAPETALAGPGPLDPSPVWPEGRDLVLARPFLDLEREQLRAYLRARGADWIEDPSNTDHAYERVRLRQAPLRADAARRLLERSDAARIALEEERAAARSRLDAGAALTAWGGAVLDRAVFTPGAAGVTRAFETLVLAASGAAAAPTPAQLGAGLDALAAGESRTAGGALLTGDGVLGRDPGAAGRADGAARTAPLALKAGETGVFDGRFDIAGPGKIEMLGARRPAAADLADVPGAFRATLPFNARTGAVLAGGDGEPGARLLARTRMSARLVALSPAAWFDGVFAEARACAALAKPDRTSNIGP